MTFVPKSNSTNNATELCAGALREMTSTLCCTVYSRSLLQYVVWTNIFSVADWSTRLFSSLDCFCLEKRTYTVYCVVFFEYNFKFVINMHIVVTNIRRTINWQIGQKQLHMKIEVSSSWMLIAGESCAAQVATRSAVHQLITYTTISSQFEVSAHEMHNNYVVYTLRENQALSAAWLSRYGVLRSDWIVLGSRSSLYPVQKSITFESFISIRCCALCSLSRSLFLCLSICLPPCLLSVQQPKLIICELSRACQWKTDRLTTQRISL